MEFHFDFRTTPKREPHCQPQSVPTTPYIQKRSRSSLTNNSNSINPSSITNILSQQSPSLVCYPNEVAFSKLITSFPPKEIISNQSYHPSRCVPSKLSTLSAIYQSLQTKMKALIAFRSKLFNPCRKLLRIFRFKLKRPVFIRAFRVRTRPHHAKVRKAPKKTPNSALLSIFRSLRQPKSRKMDKLAKLGSFSEAGHDRLLFSSPLTPAYMRVRGSSKRESSCYGDVEDACRSFENYLVEMIVEEGKVSDLMDVEELLYCWKNLTCPVFIDLVSRFYGELCTDLFSGDDDDNADTP